MVSADEFTRIFHPTDFSPASDIAFVHALKVALAGPTHLTIFIFRIRDARRIGSQEHSGCGVPPAGYLPSASSVSGGRVDDRLRPRAGEDKCRPAWHRRRRDRVCSARKPRGALWVAALLPRVSQVSRRPTVATGHAGSHAHKVIASFVECRSLPPPVDKARTEELQGKRTRDWRYDHL